MYPIDDDFILNYQKLARQGTGSAAGTADYKIIDYPFGRYQVRVVVTPTNEFVGILEIKLNQDFRTYREKIAGAGFHDVEEFYRDR